MPAKQRKLLVVTDLDGTLLDASYRWEAARDCVALLHQLGLPLVLNSSKTTPELRQLATELGTDAPLIAENGGVIAIPVGSPLMASVTPGQVVNGHHLEFPGLSRKLILEEAHSLRDQQGFLFSGFADWDSDEIARRTGLHLEAAVLAGQRHATEPIVWHDSESRWADFVEGLSVRGIRAVKGGRFIHLMGDASKATAMRAVRRLFEQRFPTIEWTTVALGDSENDLEMLMEADIAVVIPDANGEVLKPTAPKVFYAAHAGPIGWNEVLTTIIKDYSNRHG